MEKKKIVIGVDGGSTKTAVRVADLDGVTLATATYQGGGTNLHAAGNKDAVVRVLNQAIDDALRRIPAVRRERSRPEDYDIVAACVGTAGLDQPDDAELHRSVFVQCRSLRGISLNVVSDVAIIADCGTAPVRVCLIAGTGSNCYAARFDQDGQPLNEAYVGGLDLTVADDGSAAWVAHEAFREAVYAVTARDRPTQLGIALCRRFDIDPNGPNDWRRLKGVRGRLTKRQLAALSADIIAPLADRGDRVAMEIFHEAGVRLARMASGALKRLGTPRTRKTERREALLVGGMWENAFVQKTFTRCMQRTTDIRLVRVHDPTVGAIRIALRRAKRSIG